MPLADVVVGRVRTVFGVRGEVRLSADDPDVLTIGDSIRLRLERGEEVRLVLEAIRPHRRDFVARFRGVADTNAARMLRGAQLIVARERLPQLKGGAYRQADLVGMQVIDAKLGRLGVVRGIRHYPSCDMLVVGAKRVLVPMLRAYNMEIDPVARTIRVALPDGFEELS